jgi:hypothetical protein
VIKKVPTHLDLAKIKRKPLLAANAPPIDVFSTYDEQVGPNVDDYIIDPYYPEEAYI